MFANEDKTELGAPFCCEDVICCRSILQLTTLCRKSLKYASIIHFFRQKLAHLIILL